MENYAIILLAAGSSSRMGQSKQLMEIDGKPLLRHTVQTALASRVKKIVVVLGAYEKEHRAAIGNLSVNIVSNASWKNGMGNSLKSGLTQLIHSNSKLDGIVVLVCDQPLLNSKKIDLLIDTHHAAKKPIVASRYAGTVGVPVFFAKKYFQEILNLDDALGAKKIIQQHPEDVAFVDFPEGEVDLDTPQDFVIFKRRTTSYEN